MDKLSTPGFTHIAQTGVIYVMTRAAQAGFNYDSQDWANLGQGSPETGDIPGAPARVTQIEIPNKANCYAPVAGNAELRQAVADYYNQLFRQDKPSQYTYENVAIAGGGRLSLSRLVAALGNINMGHFLPDYTAYEELLSSFKAFTSTPILLERENDYQISVDALKKEILGRGLRSLLISNPCNPTGQLIYGDALKAWVDTVRECECSLIMDEFYSHYIYPQDSAHIISAAEYIRDVNKDPVIIVDGLTKNWRYPGWRISWTLGPKEIIESISSAGSYLDGGSNHPFQLCAKPLLDLKYMHQETLAINKLFSDKRAMMIDRLIKMGIKVNAAPMGGFYVWADLSDLPEPINNSLTFFEEGLKEKVITVPGFFFDVNPGGRRIKNRRYTDHCRISFGPELPVLERGLAALERVIQKY